MTLGKANREGYPKLTENHPFFGRLRAFMAGKHYWIGIETITSVNAKAETRQEAEKPAMEELTTDPNIVSKQVLSVSRIRRNPKNDVR